MCDLELDKDTEEGLRKEDDDNDNKLVDGREKGHLNATAEEAFEAVVALDDERVEAHQMR